MKVIKSNLLQGIFRVVSLMLVALTATSAYGVFTKIEVYQKQVNMPDGSVKTLKRLFLGDYHADLRDRSIGDKQQYALIAFLQLCKQHGLTKCVIEDMGDYHGKNSRIRADIRFNKQRLPHTDLSILGALYGLVDLCKKYTIPWYNAEFRHEADYDTQALIADQNKAYNYIMIYQHALPTRLMQRITYMMGHADREQDAFTISSLLIDALVYIQLHQMDAQNVEHGVFCFGALHFVNHAHDYSVENYMHKHGYVRTHLYGNADVPKHFSKQDKVAWALAHARNVTQDLALHVPAVSANNIRVVRQALAARQRPKKVISKPVRLPAQRIVLQPYYAKATKGKQHARPTPRAKVAAPQRRRVVARAIKHYKPVRRAPAKRVVRPAPRRVVKKNVHVVRRPQVRKNIVKRPVRRK